MNGQDRTTFRVPAERAGLRADVFFSLAFPFLSRTRIRQKIQQGDALLNGRRFATSARMREGDEITVAWRGPAPNEGQGADTPPVILFEDAWFVAVDKPAGQASHPSGAIQSATLIQQVRQHLRPSTEARMAEGDRAAWPTLVNRLDRFTSGIVLVARTAAALTSMQRLRGEGLVERRYLVVVEGRLSADTGTIDSPIGPAPQGTAADGSGAAVGIRMAVTSGGLPSRTEYRVLERGRDHTVLHALPRTGRQHQIRVHFASIGHPVVGDLIYRDEALFLRYWANGCRLDESLPPRHLLHAGRLVFDHPFTGMRLEIEAPVPEDFTAALAAISLRGPASPRPVDLRI
jgi:23S rRNA pseudouridine1911/1915/1917 synthase